MGLEWQVGCGFVLGWPGLSSVEGGMSWIRQACLIHGFRCLIYVDIDDREDFSSMLFRLDRNILSRVNIPINPQNWRAGFVSGLSTRSSGKKEPIMNKWRETPARACLQVEPDRPRTKPSTSKIKKKKRGSEKDTAQETHAKYSTKRPLLRLSQLKQVPTQNP